MAQTEVLPATTKPRVGRTGDPCVMVIFGFTGDLTRRKLIPALYNLASQQLLSREFAVIGVGRSPMSDDDARKKVAEDFKKFATATVDSDLWEWFLRRISYVSGDFDDPATYDKLKEALAKVDKEHNSHGNYFFYLATAAKFFGDVVERLSKLGLMAEENGHWRRVIIEKPFGHDLDSAKALNQQLQKVISERQIYRIDHYLGKETVQNILAFRFANGIFEPIWNRRYIDHVQISVAETVGVEETRRLLRWRWRPARHGAEPHHAAHHSDCDGATDLVRGECGPRRASQNPACHSALQHRGCAQQNGSRPIWRRLLRR